MKTSTYFHGTNNSAAILNALLGNDSIRGEFHMTPDVAVAKNYGREVVAITVEGDLDKAHIGIINKDGNLNKAVGNGIEVVLKDRAAVVEFYSKLYDAEVV